MDNIKAASIVGRAVKTLGRAKRLLSIKGDEAAHTLQLKAWAAQPRSELERTARALERENEAKQASLEKARDQLLLIKAKNDCAIIAEQMEDLHRVNYLELTADFVDRAKRDVAHEIMLMATDDLGTPTPTVKWFTPENGSDLSYKAEYHGDDLSGFRNRPVAGLAELGDGAGKAFTIWIDATLPVPDVAGVCAHEIAHLDPSIGKDEAKADQFAAGYLVANPQLGESQLFAKDVAEFIGDALERQVGRPDDHAPNANLDALMGVDANAPLR
jgi:hypothetical protein